jgi:5-(carboxyamino)imidazole ribonucleotide synthase
LSVFPLAPGAVIGVLGGGQLGRMLALAAARLGFDVAVLDPEREAPAKRVCALPIDGDYDAPEALERLAELADIVTFEFENVPARAIEVLASLGAEVAPSGRSLAIAQDRLAEKTFLNEAGAPTVAFAAVDGPKDIASALERLGRPLLIKTRRGGYDGKGQAWIRRPDEAEATFATIGARPAIAERPADFKRELSVIAARGRGGEIAIYPLAENHHEGGILRRSLAPAQTSPATLTQAERIAATLLSALDYVGVIGIELFERDDGLLLVNEFAPRVHNSGHWTLDGCAVDQFEQHVRAIVGWPLGPTRAAARVEMTNLLGDEIADWPRLASEADSRLWFYGKREARPGRKMGHVNRLSDLRR